MIEVLPLFIKVCITACDGMDAEIRGFTVDEFLSVRYKCVYWHNNELKEVWLSESQFITNTQEKIQIGFNRK